MIRWIYVLRYPDNVSFEEGERWYLGTHTQEAKTMKGLVRYVSWRLDAAPDWVAPAEEPAPNQRTRWTLKTLNKWDRMTELAFSSWEAFKEGAIDDPPVWTPPPYGWPGFISETILIGDRPDYDFLRDTPEVP
jgi:hypothetical protein